MGSFRIIDVTADIGLEAWGETPLDALQAAADGFLSLAVATWQAEGESSTVTYSGKDEADVVYQFLEEMLFELYYQKRVIYPAVLEEGHVVCTVRSVQAVFEMEIKAVTRHGFLWGEAPDGGRHLKVIFDI